MTDDTLAAEVAEHLAYVPIHAIPGWERCLACDQPWPCLARRLADRLAAERRVARAAANILARYEASPEQPAPEREGQ